MIKTETIIRAIPTKKFVIATIAGIDVPIRKEVIFDKILLKESPIFWAILS